MNTDIQEQEFSGDPEKCTISPTTLDTSTIALKANDCLSNAGKIAQMYNFCNIIEGVLCVKNREDGGINFVRHAWNHDTHTQTYFDETTKLDEIANNIVGKIEYQYFKCYEYSLDFAMTHQKSNGFQYSYDDLIDYMKSKVVKTN